MITSRDGLLWMDGIAASDLADQFGTPLFIYSWSDIARRIATIEHSIRYRPLRVFYSIKSWPNVEILRRLNALGVGADACSIGDLAFAKEARIDAKDTSFCGYGLSRDEVRSAVDSKAFLIVDSPNDLVNLGPDRVPDSVGVRVNIGVEAGFHPHVQAGAAGSKFGVTVDALPAIFELASHLGTVVVCLHAHVGSDILEWDIHRRVLATLLELAEAYPQVTTIDVGGGWGVPFLPDDEEYEMAAFGSAAEEMLASFESRTGRHLGLHLEPGAFLVNSAGVLLARVTGTKEPRGDVADVTASVDTSFNHLFSSAIYGTERRLWTNIDEAEGRDWLLHRITGNLMQAGDVLARGRKLPRLLDGDLIAFENAGAYCASRSSTFNERPRPAEILIDGGEAKIIRRAESIEDLMATQRIPTE